MNPLSFELARAEGTLAAQYARAIDELTVRSNLVSERDGLTTRPAKGDRLPWSVSDPASDATIAAFECVEDAWEFAHAITSADFADEMEAGFLIRARLHGPDGTVIFFSAGEEEGQGGRRG